MSSGHQNHEELSVREEENEAGLPLSEADVELNHPYIPPRPKRRPRKRKFIVSLLAAVLPGTGHLYLGLLRKGFLSFSLLCWILWHCCISHLSGCKSMYRC